MRHIAIIAAVAKNRVIGRDGRIPWDLPEDRVHFRELTMGNVIVMGRRTYEEIGHPLSGRTTYVLSSTLQIEEENCHTAASLAEVLEREPERDIFICGGASLYQEAMFVADRLYLTELSWEVEGDTYFPEIDEKMFHVTKQTVKKENCPKGDYSKGMYAFIIYEKRG